MRRRLMSLVSFPIRMITATTAAAIVLCSGSVAAQSLDPLAQSAAAAPAPAGTAFLLWDSGESLPGKLVSADGQSLTWNSPLFVDPLQVELSAISSVRFAVSPPSDAGGDSASAAPASADTESVRISMRNGDTVIGRLTSVTPQLFTVQSSRYGTIQLHASQVRSVKRIETRGLLYLGPRGLDGWRHPAVTTWQAPPGWIENSDGWLATSRPEAVMFREFEFPEKCEIEFVISSTQRPSFVLALGNKSDSSLRLESWDNALVALSNLVFVSVDTLTDSQRKVHLFLFVDFSTGLMTVFSESGRKLAEIKAKDNDPGKAGILIRNGEHDLTLEHLSVSRWDGAPFTGLRAGQSRIHLADGTVRYGEIAGMSADGRSLLLNESPTANADGTATAGVKASESRPIAGGEVTTLEVPMTEIRGLFTTDEGVNPTAVAPHAGSETGPPQGASAPSAPDHVSASAPQELPADSIQVVWNDGAVLTGHLVRLNDRELTMSTEATVEPVTCSLHGMERISFSRVTTQAEQPDRLFFAGGSLQGTLSIDNQQPDQPVRWRPPGGMNASALAAGDKARFVRGEQPESSPIDVAKFPDVVFLTNNDAVPCRVEGVTESIVQVVSPHFSETKIRVDQVKAVELSRPLKRGPSGFADDGWRRIVGTPEHTPDSVTFRASEAFGHASILKGDVVRFRLEWGRMVSAGLTFHLFTELPSNLPIGPSVRFLCRGDQISVLDGSVADPRVVRGNDHERTIGTVTVPQRTADVTIFRQNEKVRVSIDGRLVATLDAPPGRKESRGLLIRASIVNQRARVRVPGAVANNDNIIRVLDFESRDVVGGSIRQFIDEEARQHTLTIPRFRRNQPPTHVLLAPNGDLLRGRLLDIDDKHVKFESQLETLLFERERVAAVIWLKPVPLPAEDSTTEPITPVLVAPVETASPEPGHIQAMLDNGLIVTLKPLRLEEGNLIGQSSILGQCSVPSQAIREFCLGQWENEISTASYSEWIPKHAKEPEWDFGPTEGGELAASSLVGTVAPDFLLPLMDGTSFRLSDHRDKVVVLDFWASWCGPCVQGLPACIDATQSFDGSKVVFVAVNLEETPQVIRGFLERQMISPAVALDRDGSVAASFQVSGIPHTVIIGRENMIESVQVGFTLTSGGRMASSIQQILDGTWKRVRVVEPGED